MNQEQFSAICRELGLYGSDTTYTKLVGKVCLGAHMLKGYDTYIFVEENGVMLHKCYKIKTEEQLKTELKKALEAQNEQVQNRRQSPLSPRW